MKKITYLFFLFVTTISFSQIGIGTTSPDASSALDLTSINSGLLIPRMIESERDAIQDPATGLMVYQTNNTPGFYFYDGSAWSALGGSSSDDTITLDNYKDYTDAVKVTNTTTGNVNTGVLTFSYFTTTNELGTNRGQFTLDTDGITPNFTGTVDIIFNIELDTSNSARGSVGFRWYHNSASGPWVRHAYIRNSGNHNKSSINFSTTIDVVANQKIFIQSDDFANGGTVTSPAGGVEFIVIRRK
tara:strand:- start:140 stop:871 length:732 start_codon:yes stop_codon:yes gene_type:complete